MYTIRPPLQVHERREKEQGENSTQHDALENKKSFLKTKQNPFTHQAPLWLQGETVT